MLIDSITNKPLFQENEIKELVKEITQLNEWLFIKAKLFSKYNLILELLPKVLHSKFSVQNCSYTRQDEYIYRVSMNDSEYKFIRKKLLLNNLTC